MIHVSYLYGLLETIIILTFNGKVSLDDYYPDASGGQGSVLHG